MRAYTTITANFANSPIRYETLKGRPHIVAPVVMMVEGVHNGTNGPLYYPPEEFERATPAWNLKPVVVYHPTLNGAGISARRTRAATGTWRCPLARRRTARSAVTEGYGASGTSRHWQVQRRVAVVANLRVATAMESSGALA